MSKCEYKLFVNKVMAYLTPRFAFYATWSRSKHGVQIGKTWVKTRFSDQLKGINIKGTGQRSFVS